MLCLAHASSSCVGRFVPQPDNEGGIFVPRGGVSDPGAYSLLSASVQYPPFPAVTNTGKSFPSHQRLSALIIDAIAPSLRTYQRWIPVKFSSEADVSSSGSPALFQWHKEVVFGLSEVPSAMIVWLTMRFGSTAKVLLKCKLKYYRISE